MLNLAFFLVVKILQCKFTQSSHIYCFPNVWSLVWVGRGCCTQTQWGRELNISPATVGGHHWHHDLQSLWLGYNDLQRCWPELCHQRYKHKRYKKITNTLFIDIAKKLVWRVYAEIIFEEEANNNIQLHNLLFDSGLNAGCRQILSKETFL